MQGFLLYCTKIFTAYKMGTLTRIAILFGGKSAEHEISLISAMNIIDAIDRSRFEPVLIGIDRKGAWFLQDESVFLKQDRNPLSVKLTQFDHPIALIPGEKPPYLIDLAHNNTPIEVDAVFCIVHGPMGEDGTMQGLLRHINLPFVGPGVLGSAAGMDKDLMKRLMNEAGIPNAKFFAFKNHQRNQIDFAKLKRELGLPLFIKPAEMGSSVGISKVKNEEDFLPAVEKAFRYDNKILIEEFIQGREIEIAVLGNEEVKASVPGEVIPKTEFYSYEAKYVDENGAGLEAPAQNIDPQTLQNLQEAAIKIFKVLECEGLGRVDFFLKADGSIYINEINTLPGFTKISMYPRLWSLSGIPYKDLISRLIDLAIQRKARQDKLALIHAS